ncbi:hypothetical protein EVAR_67765_1 [Eumeta japonica]|uniref:Uncharacterized protein n=1 Tax=Eumeta variegata TaxID=151549 RepID=A0A4C2A8P6_EUMVA|nr:hypothetical protein EVAR_67765_1 [Eumeta japonica]
MIGKKSKMSFRNKCILQSVHTVGDMYAAPVFAHADQRHSTNFKFCKTTSVEEPPTPLVRPAANHPNPLLQSVVSYEAPTSFHPKATECSFRPTRRYH